MRVRLPLISLACLVLAAPAAAAGASRKHTSLRASAARHAAVTTLRRAEAVRSGRGVRSGFELTPLLKELAVRLPSLPAGERRAARRLMTRPTIGHAQTGEDAYAIPEHTPLCTTRFCIHWVDHNVAGHNDAPPPADADHNGIPDFIDSMAAVFEHVYQVENVQMGWRVPPTDGTRGGGLDKVDVYVKELGDQGIFGYSTPDPNQKSHSQAAYLVMDNDFSHAEYPRYTDPLLPMEVTAAHEYNHVLQFGYDVLQDTWMFEATAVWAEDKVYGDVNDYLSYLKPWTQLTQVPLTTFNSSDPLDAQNVKVYGDMVWNRWLESHYGEQVVRGAWERSLQTNPPSFAPAAYSAALATHGTNFFDAFTRFAADTAEWRSAAGPFDEGATWPDVQRAAGKTLSPGHTIGGHLDHTSYVLLNVSPTADARIKLVGRLPQGDAGAIALVGRVGFADTGAVDVRLHRLRHGGKGSVTLDHPSRYSRITAVLVNADVTQDGYSQQLGDWSFRKDGQAASALLSNDFVAPTVSGRAPAEGRKGVSRKAGVAIRFSEPVSGVSSRTLKLIGADGHGVAASVQYDPASRTAHLTPRARLAGDARYTVRLTGGIVDRGGNTVPAGVRKWGFRTGT